MRAPTQLAFDFSFSQADEKAEFTHDNVVAVLHVLAQPLDEINRFFRGCLTDGTCKKILDFLNTREAEIAFAASILLEFGRPMAVDFELFGEAVRAIIRRQLAAGKVREAGKPRRRRAKLPAQGGQGELK